MDAKQHFALVGLHLVAGKRGELRIQRRKPHVTRPHEAADSASNQIRRASNLASITLRSGPPSVLLLMHEVAQDLPHTSGEPRIMDAPTQSILLGVAANVLTNLIGKVISGANKVLTGRELLVRLEAQKRAPGVAIKRAISDTSDTFTWDGDQPTEEVCLFLQSPEIESIVTQIYSASITGTSREAGLDLIRQEFILSFCHAFEVPPDQNLEPVEDLFEHLLRTCNETLQLASFEGHPAAHEGLASLRHQVLLDELAAVRSNLALLQSPTRPSHESIMEFERSYRDQAVQRYSYIIPPNFDNVRKYPIDELYVVPNFGLNPIHTPKSRSRLTYEEILQSSRRTIILGNPGAGKTTLAQRTVHECRLRPGVPILVTLREFHSFKRGTHGSILDYIKASCNSMYGLTPPTGAFEYLLLNNRATVIFDGLDELLDTSERRTMSADIESFANLYPNASMLVTSREIGYRNAPLDERVFKVFYISPFDDSQIRSYVARWFSLDSRLLESQRDELTRDLTHQLRAILDLSCNPLMLSLLCNIYRGEGTLPKNRPDVYEKCSLMLFESWDRQRGIESKPPIGHQLLPILKFLAFEILNGPFFDTGIPERELVRKTADFLLRRQFEDMDAAEDAARHFIQFCSGRPWVFTDIGTNANFESLYQFTHRTFLEFFAAGHLVRTHTSPESLVDFLLPRIARREWDMVAQLAFQLQSRSYDMAGDSLLDLTVASGLQDLSQGSFELLYFAMRALEFIVPSASAVRRVVRSLTSALVKYGANTTASLDREAWGRLREAGNSW